MTLSNVELFLVVYTIATPLGFEEFLVAVATAAI
jgi:hypothetical protein